jgi:hypothetical protein
VIDAWSLVGAPAVLGRRDRNLADLVYQPMIRHVAAVLILQP